MRTPIPTTPRQRGCCTPPPPPLLDRAHAEELGTLLRVLGEPMRLLIFDALRRAPQAVCQCDLIELFGLEQSVMAKHLRKLVRAGLIATERRGLWAYYFIPEDSRLEEVTRWLS